ncbi:MAG: DMT family transporter [Gammaproteobacteria bacterium]|nr:DMT family transporter [Gammaproteobacteria bacterium]
MRDNIRPAIACILLAVLALSFGDAVIKLTSANFSLWQLFVLRSLPVAACLALFIALRRRMIFMPRALPWTLLRSFALCFSWVAYYISLPHLQLSVAAAGFYTGPLFIALFSAVFAGAWVGARTWFALALGFAGVLALVRPDVDGFNRYALLPIAAAVLFALAMVLTATKCRRETPAVLALWFNFALIATGALVSVWALLWPAAADADPFLLGGWTALGPGGWLTVGVLAAVMLVAAPLVIFAYQNGPPATIGAFDYGYLVFSAMWGFLAFTEVPDAAAVTGMVMIAAAGIVAVRKT